MKIDINRIMNRGPLVEKKRNRRGYDALTNHEKNILKEYHKLIKGA